jgi:hypothetical protein
METSSPVIDDVSIRIVRTNMMMRNWESEVVDITTAFVHGELEEEDYMRCPEGIELVDDGWDTMVDYTELQKTIYGTKQAAR